MSQSIEQKAQKRIVMERKYCKIVNYGFDTMTLKGKAIQLIVGFKCKFIQ